MGYSLSWIAVRGRAPAELYAEAQLAATGEREEIAESEFVHASLPGGWELLLSNTDMRFIEDGELIARLSKTGEAVACAVEEHVMMSAVSGWSGGEQKWSVRHDAEIQSDDLQVQGSPPAELSVIRNRLVEKQRDTVDADYIFDIPVELARALVGFCHNEEVEGGFLTLSSTQPPKSKKPRSLWARLIGK